MYVYMHFNIVLKCLNTKPVVTKLGRGEQFEGLEGEEVKPTIYYRMYNVQGYPQNIRI